MVENPPASMGDTGSIPDPGGSHMQRGNRAMCHNYWTPGALEPVLHNTNCNEKPEHHNERVAAARRN